MKGYLSAILGLSAFVFSCFNPLPLQAETYLHEHLKMIYDFIGLEDFPHLILPAQPPAKMYLQALYFNYDSRLTQRNHRRFFMVYEQKYRKNTVAGSLTRLIIGDADPAPQNACQEIDASLTNFQHPLLQKNLQFCYQQGENNKNHYVNYFLRGAITGNDMSSDTFWKHLQNLIPAGQPPSHIRPPVSFPLTRLYEFQDILQLPRERVWFIENHFLPLLNKPIFLPGYLPTGFKLIHFDMGISFVEKTNFRQRKSYYPYLFVEYGKESQSNKEIKLQFFNFSIKDCTNSGILNPRTLTYKSKNLGKIYICTTPKKTDQVEPDKTYLLIIPGKNFELKAQNIPLKEFLMIVDSLKTV